jgi:hypothetical protein
VTIPNKEEERKTMSADLRIERSKAVRRSIIVRPLTDKGVVWMTQFGAPEGGWKLDGVGALLPANFLPKVIALAEHEGLTTDRPMTRAEKSKALEERACRELEATLEKALFQLFQKKTH